MAIFFAVLMLWSGFWLKLVVHMGLGMRLLSRSGNFSGEDIQWDGVLAVASVGAAGMLLARTLFHVFMRKPVHDASGLKTAPPRWFATHRRIVWPILLLLAIVLAALNAVLGIQQDGLVPRTILVWPLNAMIAWLLSSGLSMAMVSVLWWEIGLGSRLLLPLCLIIIEAFGSTISLLSRGVYIFHTVFTFFALGFVKSAKQLMSRKTVAAVSVLFITFFVGTIMVTNMVRSQYYSDSQSMMQIFSGSIESLFGGKKHHDKNSYRMFMENSQLSKLPSFVIDRWIGMEGMMATNTYPDKGYALLKAGLVEKRQIGKGTLYQEICQSVYRFANIKKFQFASIPGPIAFFYYSGSMLVVFFGMMLLTFFLLGSEVLVFRLTGNPLLCAWLGAFFANLLCQFGLAPISMVPYLFEMAIGVVAIALATRSSLLTRVSNRVLS